MDRGADPAALGRVERGDPLDPCVDVPIAEPALRERWARRSPASVRPPCRYSVSSSVMRIPASRAAATSASPISFGFGVRRAVGLVVEVVELADARDAGQRHLGERRSREPVVAVRLESFGGPVHQVTPRPERAAVRLRPRSQCAMERVAVRVREAGDREAGETDRVRRPARRRRRPHRTARRPPRSRRTVASGRRSARARTSSLVTSRLVRRTR